MPVINKEDKAKATRYLTTVTAALKAVANGDEDTALQTLQDMVEDSDTSFEDTLDATETLASLIKEAEKAGFDEEEELDEEEDEEEEDLEETSRLRTKASAKKRVDVRATFLETALSSLEDDEDEEEEEEDEEVASDDELEEDEVTDADDEEEDFVEESKLSKRIADRRQARASATAKVATPKAAVSKKAADRKGRI